MLPQPHNHHRRTPPAIPNPRRPPNQSSTSPEFRIYAARSPERSQNPPTPSSTIRPKSSSSRPPPSIPANRSASSSRVAAKPTSPRTELASPGVKGKLVHHRPQCNPCPNPKRILINTPSPTPI